MLFEILEKVFLFLRNTSLFLFYPLFITTYCLVVLAFSFSLKIQDKLSRSWARNSLKWFGIKVKVHGEEYAPALGSCLYLFNHKSFLDIPIILASLKYRSRFGAKKELFRIPILGNVLRSSGCLPIDRDNRQKSIQAYQKGEKALAKGMRFILAPEGGRKKIFPLGPFKSGPFIFAISNSLPIIPIVFKGAHELLPKGSVFPNKNKITCLVEVHILKPISTKELSIEDRYELKKRVFAEMEKILLAPKV